MAGILNQNTPNEGASLHATLKDSHLAQLDLRIPLQNDSLTESVCLGIKAVFENFSRAPEIRAVLFSIGITNSDLDVCEPWVSSDLTIRHVSDQTPCAQASVRAVENCEKAVICIVSGVCAGLALEFAYACDMRICVSDAQFCVEHDSPSGPNILRNMVKVAGNGSLVREIAMSGRDFNADEALRLGLVNRVWKSWDEAASQGLRLAQLIGQRDPSTLRKVKKGISRVRGYKGLSLPKIVDSGFQMTGTGDLTSQDLDQRSTDYSNEELEADLNQALGFTFWAKL